MKKSTIINRIGMGNLIAFIILVVLLFLIIAPNIIQVEPRDRIQATKNQIMAISTVLGYYYSEVGRYPSTSQGLKALLEKPKGPGAEKWAGPYTSAKEIPRDGWNRELHYRYPGIHNPDHFDLWSYGADGKMGGEKNNADIGNWK